MSGYLKFLLIAVSCGILCGEAVAADVELKLNALEKIEKGKAEAAGVVSKWKNQAIYRISVKNSSAGDATNLTAKYHIFVVRDNGLNDLRKAAMKPERVSGTIDIPLVKAGETVMVETKPVTLSGSAITNGATQYSNQSRGNRSDTTRGIWIQLFSGDKMVGEFSSLPSLKKTGPF